MEDTEARLLAQEFLQFAFLQMKWRKTHIDAYFNINGKGGCEITIRQFQILMAIQGLGLNTLSQLAEHTHISKSSMSLTISKLVQEGYLRREQASGTEDGRKIYFYVTDKGTDVLSKIGQNCVLMVTKFCEQLSQEKRDDLKIGIQRLSRVYEE